MSHKAPRWTARVFARGRTSNGRWLAITTACLFAWAGCADEPSAHPREASNATVDETLTPGELIGRFPKNPSDQTSGEIIEGAMGLAVGDGAIHVLDRVAGSVLRFDLSARLLSRAGSPGEGPAELSSPMGIAVGRNGEVWVADPAAGRLSRFAGSGTHIEEYRTPYPPVNIGVSATGMALIPTLSERSLLARVSADGATDLVVDPNLVPSEVSAGPSDRISFRGLMFAGLPDGSFAMLQNRHGTNFRAWTIDVDRDATRIEGIAPLPLPGWLYTILEEEVEVVRRTVPEEFAQGDFLVPFKGMHAVGGRLWLVPSPSSRVIALSVPTRESQTLTVVVGGEAVYRGLIDAAVMGDRLIALYRTELRIYRLEGAEVTFAP
ncbi:MAG: hypothetical protein ACC682_00065 [Gemmatimonadota bacterium]